MFTVKPNYTKLVKVKKSNRRVVDRKPFKIFCKLKNFIRNISIWMKQNDNK